MSCKLGDKCDNVFACNILRPNVELLGCNFYKPKKPMNNEEHLKSCNTEQLAEWLLVHMDCIGCPASCEKCHRYYDACKETILEWLKQPHTFE